MNCLSVGSRAGRRRRNDRSLGSKDVQWTAGAVRAHEDSERTCRIHWPNTLADEWHSHADLRIAGR